MTVLLGPVIHYNGPNQQLCAEVMQFSRQIVRQPVPAEDPSCQTPLPNEHQRRKCTTINAIYLYWPPYVIIGSVKLYVDALTCIQICLEAR